MRISFDWLKEFVEITASPQEVADRLTMVGLEIEGMESVDGDTLFEVNVTPNRPDCLSVLGIAREVAAAFDLPLKIPDTTISSNLPPSDITVEIADSDLCNRYAGRLIRGVSIGDSPEWIKKRLEKCGLRALNNIVDITNYVLLEMGHPLHAFDADKLSGRKIRIARAGQDRDITTLDGVERKLHEDSLLIWDGREPVAVAGVMGGEESSVDAGTKDIFLESAFFDPSSIRRTSKMLGLKTESSYRFERGTDIEFLINALDRAALLMKQISGGAIHGIVDAYPVKYSPATVMVDHKRVNSILGTDLKKEDMRNILEKILIRTDDMGDTFTANPPAFRRDIKEYIDIVEEIARCHGFNRIPVTIPKTGLSAGVLNRKEMYLGNIRDSIRKAGFTEVINYSFMNIMDLNTLSLPDNDLRRRHITLKNPLRQEDSHMRTSLIPSLINNFVYNLSRGVRDIKLFETAKVFIDEGGQLPVEELRLGVISYHENIPVLWKDNLPAFLHTKGALQNLLAELKVQGYSLLSSEEVFLHKGKSADIIIKGKKIGYIGELAPNVIEALNLKIQKPEIIVFELNLDLLMSGLSEKISYAQIPKYPAVDRDMAVILNDSITSGEVLDMIKGYQAALIENIELFDHYKGKNIPPDKKSLGFRITYRSKERTLTDDEVEAVHHSLVNSVLEKTGGTLRG